jgi:hypothetical protein
VGERRAISFALREHVHQIADQRSLDPARQGGQRIAAVGQEAQFDRSQAQLVGVFRYARPDFAGDPADGGFQADPGSAQITSRSENREIQRKALAIVFAELK